MPLFIKMLYFLLRENIPLYCWVVRIKVDQGQMVKCICIFTMGIMVKWYMTFGFCLGLWSLVMVMVFTFWYRPTWYYGIWNLVLVYLVDILWYGIGMVFTVIGTGYYWLWWYLHFGILWYLKFGIGIYGWYFDMVLVFLVYWLWYLHFGIIWYYGIWNLVLVYLVDRLLWYGIGMVFTVKVPLYYWLWWYLQMV